MKLIGGGGIGFESEGDVCRAGADGIWASEAGDVLMFEWRAKVQ